MTCDHGVEKRRGGVVGKCAVEHLRACGLGDHESPPKHRIVMDDQGTVTGSVDVELDTVTPHVHRQADSMPGVLDGMARRAAVGDDKRRPHRDISHGTSNE